MRGIRILDSTSASAASLPIILIGIHALLMSPRIKRLELTLHQIVFCILMRFHPLIPIQVLFGGVLIHVSQLRRYEGGSSSPTLDVLRKLAIALSVSSDTLVFDAERDSDEELRLQLEATQRLTDQDRELVKRFINGLLLSHEAKRLAA